MMTPFPLAGFGSLDRRKDVVSRANSEIEQPQMWKPDGELYPLDSNAIAVLLCQHGAKYEIEVGAPNRHSALCVGDDVGRLRQYLSCARKPVPFWSRRVFGVRRRA